MDTVSLYGEPSRATSNERSTSARPRKRREGGLDRCAVSIHHAPSYITLGGQNHARPNASIEAANGIKKLSKSTFFA
jgi:hypothetical protein